MILLEYAFHIYSKEIGDANLRNDKLQFSTSLILCSLWCYIFLIPTEFKTQGEPQVTAYHRNKAPNLLHSTLVSLVQRNLQSKDSHTEEIHLLRCCFSLVSHFCKGSSSSFCEIPVGSVEYICLHWLGLYYRTTAPDS